MFKRKKRRSKDFRDTSKVIDFDEAREKRRHKRKDQKRKGSETVSSISAKEINRKPKKGRIFRIYAAIMIVIIAVISVYGYNILTLKMEEKEVRAKNEALVVKKARLEREITLINNPEYMEQQARTQLKMIMPGEILYIIPEADKAVNNQITKEDGQAGGQDTEGN